MCKPPTSFSSYPNMEAFPGHSQAKQDLAASRRHVEAQGQGSPRLDFFSEIFFLFAGNANGPVSDYPVHPVPGGAWLAFSPAAQFRLWTASRVALGRKVSNAELCLQGG